MNVSRVIDFRSDTVTRPTVAMRRAMAEAIVGDDVLGDDPTVKELERRFAQLLGKEAALFCPSGSMCNLIAVCVWCRPGDEVLMEEGTHTFRYEGGGASRFAGVQIRTFARASGIPELEDVRERIRNPNDIHQPRSSLFVLENTHNIAGGRVVPLERVRQLADLVHEHGMRMHMDGARLFNAATAAGIGAADFAAPVDSVMCCLSKGLGAPIGSCLAGTQGFIDEARRVRKALGGGMRQVGVLAAAGLIALEDGAARLHEDHARARRFAAQLDGRAGLRVEPSAVETNMVMVDLDGIETGAMLRTLAERGLLVLAPKTGRLRFVFHRDLTEQDVEDGIRIVAEAAGAVLAGRGVAGDGPDAEPWNG